MDEITQQRKCTRCKEVKAIADFVSDKYRADGLSCWCKKCHSAKKAIQRASKKAQRVQPVPIPETKICFTCKKTKSASAFHKNFEQGLSSWCKDCSRAWRRERSHDRKNNLKKYGLTIEQYDKMFQEQGGVCAICGQPETHSNQTGIKTLGVDHDHATGKIRGLLCLVCNLKLGTVEINDCNDRLFVIRAMRYLHAHQWKEYHQAS